LGGKKIEGKPLAAATCHDDASPYLISPAAALSSATVLSLWTGRSSWTTSSAAARRSRSLDEVVWRFSEATG
jgi:hypothetical protein